METFNSSDAQHLARIVRKHFQIELRLLRAVRRFKAAHDPQHLTRYVAFRPGCFAKSILSANLSNLTSLR